MECHSVNPFQGPSHSIWDKLPCLKAEGPHLFFLSVLAFGNCDREDLFFPQSLIFLTHRW